MKKSEILKNYRLDKMGENTVSIQNNHFNFFYTNADDVVKLEYIGKYRYLGGLQCRYNEKSIDYKNLENWLCEIAEKVLNIKIKDEQ